MVMDISKGHGTLSVDAARGILRHLMECDSEASYCAGWVVDNEYRLWCQVARDVLVAGELDDNELYDWLRELSEVAGGWWVAPPRESAEDVRAFTTMLEWLPLYEAHRKGIIEKYGPEGWAGELPRARERHRAFMKETFGEEVPRKADLDGESGETER